MNPGSIELMLQEKPAWTCACYHFVQNIRVFQSPLFRYADCRQEGRAKLCCAFKAGEGWPLHFALIQSTMVTSVVLLCLGIVILVLLLRSQRPKNFPPGPPVLPLLGSILELALDNPLQDFERVRKTAINDFRGIFNFLICVINSCDL